MLKVLYPGSFDPVTNGHISAINRLSRLFESVTVLVSENQSKTYFFELSERVHLVREAVRGFSNVNVDSFLGLTIDYAKKNNFLTLARSLRGPADLEYEQMIAEANRKMAPEIDTLFLVSDGEYKSVSSTLVREIASFGGDTSVFVPEVVHRALQKKGKR